MKKLLFLLFIFSTAHSTTDKENNPKENNAMVYGGKMTFKYSDAEKKLNKISQAFNQILKTLNDQASQNELVKDFYTSRANLIELITAIDTKKIKQQIFNPNGEMYPIIKTLLNKIKEQASIFQNTATMLAAPDSDYKTKEKHYMADIKQIDPDNVINDDLKNIYTKLLNFTTIENGQNATSEDIANKIIQKYPNQNSFQRRQLLNFFGLLPNNNTIIVIDRRAKLTFDAWINGQESYNKIIRPQKLIETLSLVAPTNETISNAMMKIHDLTGLK